MVEVVKVACSVEAVEDGGLHARGPQAVSLYPDAAHRTGAKLQQHPTITKDQWPTGCIVTSMAKE